MATPRVLIADAPVHLFPSKALPVTWRLIPSELEGLGKPPAGPATPGGR